MKPFLICIAILYLALNSETLEYVAPYIIPYVFWSCVSAWFLINVCWKHRSVNG